MIEDSYVVFKIKVNHKKVQEEWDDFITNPNYTGVIRDSMYVQLQALMCSEYVYVPEPQLSRYVKYGEVVK